MNSREVHETMCCDKERDALTQARESRGLRGLEYDQCEYDCVIDRLHELERCTLDITSK